VEYIGSQDAIMETGRAEATLSLAEVAGVPDLYAVGPAEGLDGEITVFDSEAYVSRVRGAGFVVDSSFDHRAIFLVWARIGEWDDGTAVPDTISTLEELERFVAETARRRGLDTGQPFPFLLAGTPRRLDWHINVDRTAGRPITRELFQASKERYTLRGERTDIFGVHSPRHEGIFTGRGTRVHMHFVSRDGPATGHVDDIDAAGLTLRLPRR